MDMAVKYSSEEFSGHLNTVSVSYLELCQHLGVMPTPWGYANTLCVTYSVLQALDAWEHACAAIEKREEALMELQSFEEAASDPARFFARGIVFTQPSLILLRTCVQVI